MKQNLFFDLDGTLSDPMLGITHSVQYALKKYGIVVEDLQQLCPFIGPPLQDSFQDFYGLTKEEAERACDYYHENFLAKGIYENTLYPGMEEFLQRLTDEGKTLFVATSKPEPLAKRILEYFGIDSYFHFVGGDTIRYPDDRRPETRYTRSQRSRHTVRRGALRIWRPQRIVRSRCRLYRRRFGRTGDIAFQRIIAESSVFRMSSKRLCRGCSRHGKC